MEIVRSAPLLAILSVLASSCSEPPKAIEKPSIKVTGFFGPVLDVDIDLHGDARDAALLDRAGAATVDLGKELASEHPPVNGKVETVQVTYLGPAGGDKTVGRKIMHLTFPAQDLREGAHMGADGRTMLDFASEGGSWEPANDDVLRDYCSQHPGGFCVLVGP